MKYSTVSDTATRWGISPQRVRLLCSQGRVDQAKKVGRDWLIPTHALKPILRVPGRKSRT